MAGSLYPAFVTIDYETAYGVHKMTLPTLAYDPAPTPGDEGEFSTWAAGSILASSMIDTLITALVQFWPNTMTFQNVQVFTMASPTASPVPQFGYVSGEVGTLVSSAWAKAVQQTMTFRTTVNSLLKIVLLDVPTNNNFDRNTTVTPGGPVDDVLQIISSQQNGWSARIEGRPYAFLQAAATLNEKLRRAYRMN